MGPVRASDWGRVRRLCDARRDRENVALLNEGVCDDPAAVGIDADDERDLPIERSIVGRLSGGVQRRAKSFNRLVGSPLIAKMTETSVTPLAFSLVRRLLTSESSITSGQSPGAAGMRTVADLIGCS